MRYAIPISRLHSLASCLTRRATRANRSFSIRPCAATNPMILRLFRRTPPVDTIACLYGTIVAQARTRAFYRVYGVPDTVNGRLEMIMLHAVLILQRLEREPATVRALGQGIFDRFCRDMDESMREMGVGDLAVPRKMDLSVRNSPFPIRNRCRCARDGRGRNHAKGCQGYQWCKGCGR